MDGRYLTVHTRAGFELREFGVPIDVLGMRISKKQDDPKQTFGFFQHGKLLVLLDRGDYWQCGFVIPKGAVRRNQSARTAAISKRYRQLRGICSRPGSRAG